MRITVSLLSLAVTLASFVGATPLQVRDDPALPESATLIVKNAAGEAIAYGANDGRFLALPDANEASNIGTYEVKRVFEDFPVSLRATIGQGGDDGVCTTTFPGESLLVCGADRPADDVEGDLDFHSFYVFEPTFENDVWVFGTTFGLTLENEGDFLRLHPVGDNETVADADKVTLVLGEVSA